MPLCASIIIGFGALLRTVLAVAAGDVPREDYGIIYMGLNIASNNAGSWRIGTQADYTERCNLGRPVAFDLIGYICELQCNQ